MTGDPHWRDHAACGGTDPEQFSPEQPRISAAAAIRRFCTHCPVVAACRSAAETLNERGVWGGLFFTGWPRPRGVPLDHLGGGLGPASGGTLAPRGDCPTCGRDVALRGDGRVRRHHSCPGEGTVPRSRAS